ncbi:MAG: hypothetical protein H7Y36_10810 [Armatimonadetes bacterium]|nr:hypothetical protein [Akkermansiaceae bacterium]
MKQSLVIELANLPEEGEAVSGELDGKIFDLPTSDATSAGPLGYDLWVQRFDSELLLTGHISAPFYFICVVTLKKFLQTIHLKTTAISVEIADSGLVDVTEALREEILLEFPVNPRCDEGDVPEPCEIDPRYLAVDNTPGNDLSPAPRKEGDNRWSALDDLTGLNDQT